MSAFRWRDDYAGVALSLTEALTELCVADDIARASVSIALDEIAENVVHHGDTPIGGFGAAQGWQKNNEFEIAIADLGIGIRASLTKNPDQADITDDVAAITRALEPRVSATPERNAGHWAVHHETVARSQWRPTIRPFRVWIYSGWRC